MKPMCAPAQISRALARTRGFRFLALGLLFSVVLAGCQSTVTPTAPGQTSPKATGVVAPTATNQAAQNYTAKLQLTPPQAEIGKRVEVRGTGYSPNAAVDLVYYTVDGRYELQDRTEFVGERFDPRSQVIASVKADQTGAISTSFEVPLDYGGAHDLRGRVAGTEVSQASLTILPTFSLTPSDGGPVGSPIELRIIGVDWRTNINTWHVLWDNAYLGFMSGVLTKGVAVARFRAAGSPGVHQISVWHNSFFSVPYLNFQQGPYKDTPTGKFQFRVTSDPGVTDAQIENYSANDNPWPVSTKGTGTLKLSVDRGAVGIPTTLRGSNLPANTDLDLRWATMVGNRVSAIGFSEETRSIGNVRTGADGTFTKDLAIPDDLGGQHRIDVTQGDKVVAAAGLVIQPSVVSYGPTKLTAGEEVKIHLKGVGWTTYENTYAVTYDNSYIGYVCGFSTAGDVQFTVTATGAPGTHIIDLYPTIYKGQDQQPRIYSVPQLTYATDHPQRITPAIRLTVVTAPAP